MGTCYVAWLQAPTAKCLKSLGRIGRVALPFVRETPEFYSPRVPSYSASPWQIKRKNLQKDSFSTPGRAESGRLGLDFTYNLPELTPPAVLWRVPPGGSTTAGGLR